MRVFNVYGNLAKVMKFLRKELKTDQFYFHMDRKTVRNYHISFQHRYEIILNGYYAGYFTYNPETELNIIYVDEDRVQKALTSEYGDYGKKVLEPVYECHGFSLHKYPIPHYRFSY